MTLLWELSRASNASVPLHELRFRDPRLTAAFDWLMASNLAALFQRTPELRQLLYYNRDAAVLSAENPELAFYLRYLDWQGFARVTGHQVAAWDPLTGPVFCTGGSPGASPGGPASHPAPLSPRHSDDEAAFVLHLSDLHFGTENQAVDWFSQLASDLKYELSCHRLGAAILAGDIADKATQEEYAAARRFLESLQREFGLSPERIILVPGNHDVSWSRSEQSYTPERRRSYRGELRPGEYIDAGDYIEVRDPAEYKRRFEPFAAFYLAVCLQPYSLEYEGQFTLHHVPGLNLLVLGLNSAWQTDHHFRDRASINPHALSLALDEVRRSATYQGCTKLAVWHHAISAEGEDRIKDKGFLELLVQAGFRLALHGHVHKADNQQYRYYRGVPGGGIELIGAGTFGAPTHQWVPGYPLQYQLLRFGHGRVTVHTRRREEPTGAWKPDARWLQAPGKDPLPRYEVIL